MICITIVNCHCFKTQQILQIKKIKERYKLIVSDGVAYMNAVLDTGLNAAVETEEMKDLTLIRIEDGFIKDVGERKLWCVTKCQAIRHSVAKIKNPVRYDTRQKDAAGAAAVPTSSSVASSGSVPSQDGVKKKPSRFQPRQVKGVTKKKKIIMHQHHAPRIIIKDYHDDHASTSIMISHNSFNVKE